jgi:transcriptional regulator of acetoin/glycerol metabolism
MSRVMVRHPVRTDLRTKPADHINFVVQGRPAEPTTAEVSSSWQRSAHLHHVDPDSREAPRILTSREVGERREPLDQLIFSAGDELDRLYKVVREAGYTLLFCDNAGVAVEHRGDAADASRFRYWGTWLGGVWDEAFEGTNGIGTCISEERPVTIHRGQHYRTRHIDLSCSGAPIFGTDGRLMAVLDVSAIDPALGTSPRVDGCPDNRVGACHRRAIFPGAVSKRLDHHSRNARTPRCGHAAGRRP